jgi:hypothetical protein
MVHSLERERERREKERGRREKEVGKEKELWCLAALTHRLTSHSF